MHEMCSKTIEELQILSPSLVFWAQAQIFKLLKDSCHFVKST